MCADGRRVFGRNARLVFAKSGVTCVELYPTPAEGDGDLGAIEGPRSEECVLHDQSSSASLEIRAKTMPLKSFLLFRGGSGAKDEIS